MEHSAKLSGREGDLPPARPALDPTPTVQTPHPGPGSAPQAGVPVTDGTPAACRQKNAAGFLAGDTPGIMAAYGGGEREPGSDIPTLESEDTVRDLVRWRQEAPYG